MDENVTVMSFGAARGIVSMHPGGVMESETAWMARMKLAALALLAFPPSSSVRVEDCASLTLGCVTMRKTVRMAQMNSSTALGEPA